ncbi:MAG: response regulator transcription factor [Bacteroidetes bacterium]|nr:response regulator transcription factor [Bacteroidota bacterium]
MDTEKYSVLLAEDDENLGALLRDYLIAKGYNCTLTRNGDEALTVFFKKGFHICILDVMMPIKDGITLAKEIRKANKQIPLIFLTAKSMKEDKLEGFQAGADDYMTKPFSMEELLMRLKAITRRVYESDKKNETDEFAFGIYEFNYRLQTLKAPSGDNKLTSKEADLLKLLCENLNSTVDRSFALKLIWGDDSYFNARSMDVYVTKLRKYLKEDTSIELLNIHGKGFRLVTK